MKGASLGVPASTGDEEIAAALFLPSHNRCQQKALIPMRFYNVSARTVIVTTSTARDDSVAEADAPL